MPTVQDYYNNIYQYGLEDYTTSSPEGDVQAVSYNPGYLPELLDLQDKVRSGQASGYERDWFQQQYDAAMALPLRDVSQLTYNAGEDAADRVSGGSPDLARMMLTLRSKMESGQASEQEQQLFTTTLAALRDQDFRARVPQESDRFSIMGDNLLSALGVLGLGATGGLAAGALAGGGLGLAGTLGSAGTLAGIAGTGASTLGSALQQPWLQKAGLALGALGGVAGGAGGLANLWGTGINSLTDAARLASSAGRITGALGSASGNEGLRQAARYLGQAGQLGSLGGGLLPTSLTDWSGTNAPLAANAAPDVSNLLSAADMATQRGGGMDYDYSWDYGGTQPYDNWSNGNVWAGGSPTFDESGGGGGWGYDPSTMLFQQNPLYEGGTPSGGGWGYDPSTGQFSNAPISGDTSGGGGGWLSSLMGGLGAVGGFLGRNAGTLGPLVSTLGGVASGAIGSNAARDASAQQTAALNRGIDLQTAQWLQQQANQAPWLQAGREALGHMQGRMAWSGPQQPGATPAISGANYQLPGTTPGWTPQAIDAGAYRWTPGQGPRAADYRYTPGQTPDAAPYASGLDLYRGAMPGTQVSTLTGQQVLDQDPGAAFRQSEARKALEGSAAARGGLLSGSTLGALQRQSQDLASQEYGNAWQRMMARDTEQYGRNWGQYQQAWNQGVQGTQLGMAANAQNFGQALSAAQLRESVNQQAQQMGWSQAQAEAAFREQMGQQASQQGFQQALAGQQWNQGQQQQWQQEQYARQLQDVQTRYGWDTAQNATDYQRQQIAYQQQLAELQRQWGQFSTLAGYGQTATNQVGNQGLYANEALGKLYSQLGTAQGTGTWGQAYPWQSVISGAGNNLQNIFRSLNA